MGNVDWVTERSSCSLVKVFETLKIEVKEDVDSRNKARSIGEACRFSIAVHGHTFTVFAESNQPSKSVSFTLSNNWISVLDGNEKEILKAYLTLNDLGECRFKINNQEREFWQMRMAALENLFFD